MSLGVLPLQGQESMAIRLIATAVAVPALTSHIRPALVLNEHETRTLFAAIDQQGVRNGGLFASGPSGVQFWSGPFDGADGGPGTARHLGSLDWNLDSPAKHYATVYRAMVTADGVEYGETTASVLARVLALAGLSVEGNRVAAAIPPPRDPFRARAT